MAQSWSKLRRISYSSAVWPSQASVWGINCKVWFKSPFWCSNCWIDLWIVKFAVTDIQDIKWFSSLFKCLMIPNEQREVIIAFVKTWLRLMSSVPFDDFVADKGCSLNVFLQYDPQHFTLSELTLKSVEHSALEKPWQQRWCLSIFKGCFI